LPTVTYIQHYISTEKAHGSYKFCPRATCGPRACSWTTLA